MWSWMSDSRSRGLYSRRRGETDGNQANQVNDDDLSNPVALMSRMEAELTEIRRLAISRGRRYQTAIRRLDCLEEALLSMFEVRLQLMENIILRPRFAAAAQTVIQSPSPSQILTGGFTPVTVARDLENSLFYLKNRVHLLQRRVYDLHSPQEHLPGPSTRNNVPDNAEIIKRELEKIIQQNEDRNHAETVRKDNVSKPQKRPSSSVIPRATVRESRSIPIKRSKFTC